MRPGGLGTRPMIDSAVTLLPQPDSPTMASVRPGDVEADAVDGGEFAARDEVGAQVADGQGTLIAARRRAPGAPR